MNLDWIEPLQQEIGALYAAVLLLNTSVQSLTTWEARRLTHANLTLIRLYEWAMSLPRQEKFWCGVWFAEYLERLASYIEAARCSLHEMRLSLRLRNAFDNPISDIIALTHRLALLENECHREKRAEETYLRTTPLKRLDLSPVELMTVLRITLYRDIRSAMPLEQDSSRRVVYHPRDTFEVISTLIWLFTRFGQSKMWLSCVSTPSFFEVRLSKPGLLLMPFEWNRLRNNLRFRLMYTFESLYNIDIEPLVWHDEPGDGVIVRLPWATS
jgi:hypothetical protein